MQVPPAGMRPRSTFAARHALACTAAIVMTMVLRAPSAAAVTALTNWTNGFMTFYGARLCDTIITIGCLRPSCLQGTGCLPTSMVA